MSETKTKLAYKPASADIVYEEFDGDLVILNLASGQYFGLNQSGMVIWQAISQSCGLDAIAEYTGNDAVLRGFTTSLEKFGLISSSEQTAEIPSALAEQLRGCDAAPTIECYDDLADLIVADPIHDVDPQVGWPKLPEGT